MLMFVCISCRFIDALKDHECAMLYMDDYLYGCYLLCGRNQCVVSRKVILLVVFDDLMDLHGFIFLTVYGYLRFENYRLNKNEICDKRVFK